MTSVAPLGLQNEQKSNGSNKKQKYPKIISEITDKLHLLEEENVSKRIKCCELGVNDTISKLFNQPKIKFNYKKSNLKLFKFSKKANDYTQWIKEWKPRKQSFENQSKESIVSRAKTWRNCKKSNVYGNTLFVDLMEEALQYGKYVSNTISHQKKKIKELFAILKNEIIYDFLDSKVELSNDTSGGYVRLICLNSIQKETKFQQLLISQLPNNETFETLDLESLKKIFEKQMMDAIASLEQQSSVHKLEQQNQQKNGVNPIIDLTENSSNEVDTNTIVTNSRHNHREIRPNGYTCVTSRNNSHFISQVPLYHPYNHTNNFYNEEIQALRATISDYQLKNSSLRIDLINARHMGQSLQNKINYLNNVIKSQQKTINYLRYQNYRNNCNNNQFPQFSSPNYNNGYNNNHFPQFSAPNYNNNRMQF